MKKENKISDNQKQGNDFKQCFCLDNLIYFDEKIVKIEAITKDIISVSGIERNRFTPLKLSNKLISFVPISYVILEKLSFIKQEFGHDTYTWNFKDFEITDSPTEIYDENGAYIDTNLESRKFYLENDKEINYLHEIQNIAFHYYGYVLNAT